MEQKFTQSNYYLEIRDFLCLKHTSLTSLVHSVAFATVCVYLFII